MESVHLVLDQCANFASHFISVKIFQIDFFNFASHFIRVQIFQIYFSLKNEKFLFPPSHYNFCIVHWVRMISKSFAKTKLNDEGLSSHWKWIPPLQVHEDEDDLRRWPEKDRLLPRGRTGLFSFFAFVTFLQFVQHWFVLSLAGGQAGHEKIKNQHI